jgi:hypothetical protein
MAISSRVVYDQFVNYFYPQYPLPWNNFFGRVIPEPYYQRTVTINQNALIAKTAIQYNSSPVLLTQTSTLPNWMTASITPSIGEVLTDDSRKFFLGKYFTSFIQGFENIVGLEYQYELDGQLFNVACACGSSPADKWVILLFNLYPAQNNRKQAVALIGTTGTPALDGSITFNGTTVQISKPKTIDKYDGTGNTVYGVYYNRLFIAIKASTFTTAATSVDYHINTRIVQFPTIAQGLQLDFQTEYI